MTDKCDKCDGEKVCTVCRASAAGKVGGRARSKKKILAGRSNAAKARAVMAAVRRAAGIVPLKERKAARAKVLSRVWTREDTLDYIEKHPNMPFSAVNVIDYAPARKRKSARVYAGQHLSLYAGESKIKRVERGTYLYEPSLKDGHARNF